MRDLKDKIYFYTEGEFLEMLEEIVNATSKDKSLKGKKLEKNFETEISEKMYEDLKYCLRGEKKVDRK